MHVDHSGDIVELEVEQDELHVRIPAAGASFLTSTATAA